MPAAILVACILSSSMASLPVPSAQQWSEGLALRQTASIQSLILDEYASVQSLALDESAHQATVKASYQSNVKTIYTHLEEIIKKILAHKTKWTKKYNGDIAQIAKGLFKHQNAADKKAKGFATAKGKAGAAKALSDVKAKSWHKAKSKLKQKIDDASKEKKALKALYLKGLKQKKGEICMIRKIQCTVAKFNGEANLQQKYCSMCTEMATSRSKSAMASARRTRGTASSRRLKYLRQRAAMRKRRMEYLRRRAAMRKRRLQNKKMQQ